MALKVSIATVDRTSLLESDTLEVTQEAGVLVTTCSFQLLDVASNVTITAKSEVLVEETVSGMVYFKGTVAGIDYERFGKAGGRHIIIDCQDYNQLPAEYIIDDLEEFGAAQDNVIIDTLFDKYLPAVDSETFVAHLFVFGEISFENTTLADALNEICKQSQGRWYIDDQKRLHYFSAEADAAPWNLSDTPNDTTTFAYLSEPVKTVDATQVVTRVLVVGADVAILTVDAAAETALGTQFGAVVRDNTLLGVTAVTDRGEAIVAQYSMPLVTYTAPVSKEGLKAGMDIGFKCDIYDVNETLTIRRITITWPEKTALYELEIGDSPFTAAATATGIKTITVEAQLPITAARLPTSSKGWTQALVFSAADHDTVVWAGGDITLADGTVYTIVAGNTGNMGALTYIYLDLDTSETVLQTVGVASTAVGTKKILIAVATPQAVGLEATFYAFGGAGQNTLVDTNNIADGAIEALQIAAQAVETAKIKLLAVDTAQMKDSAITTGKILARTIVAGDIALVTLTAAEIAAATITGAKIAANTIESGNIKANTIEAGDIKGNTITATEIAGATITTNEIAANTILAGNIAAGAVKTDELDALAVTAAKIAAGVISADKLHIGNAAQYFTENDGLLLLGPGCALVPGSWQSLRGQAAPLTGAFHQVNGRWGGTRALMVEEVTTNIDPNPVFGNGTTGWAVVGSTIAESEDHVFAGTKSMKVTYVDSDYLAYNLLDITFAVWCISAYVWVPTGTSATDIYLFPNGYVGSTDVIVERWVTGDPTNCWTRLVSTIDPLVSDVSGHYRLYSIDMAVDEVIYIDGVQTEKHDYPTSLCYGDQAWSAWSGTAHNSNSVRVNTEVNLDAYASPLSDNDTWSVSMWWQPQYDADANWPDTSMLFDVRGANDNNRVMLEFDDDDDKYNIFMNGAWRFQSTAQTFKAGDQQHILITFDFANDEYIVYVKGVEDGSDATALTAPTALVEMNLGTQYDSTQIANAAYSELALFDSVLTTEEVAAIYQSGKPLTDQGATDTPGIYILDGNFRIASSTTGQRIDIDSDEIAGYDSVGTKQFYIQASDGTGYFGGGLARLDADGLQLVEGDDNYNKILWRRVDLDGAAICDIFAHVVGDDSVLFVRSYGYAGLIDPQVQLSVQAYEGSEARFALYAIHGGIQGITGTNIQSWILHDGTFNTFDMSDGDLEIRLGDAVGAKHFKVLDSAGAERFAVDSDGDITTSTHIATNAGNEWNFGGTAGGTVTPDTKIHVEIDGSWFTLAAKAGLV